MTIRGTEAAILEKLCAPLVIDEVTLTRIRRGQVLVRVYCSGICGTQLEEIAAKEDKHLPHLLGHEGGGIVEGIGPDVSRVSADDHVVMHWRRGDGIEANHPQYQWGEKLVGGGLVTTFNEYAVVSENRLTAIAKDIPFDVAALMGCAVTTGFGVVFKEARLRPGDSLAVIGCGGVGLNVIQAAALVLASPIIAFDMNDTKLLLAKEFGADVVYNAKRTELRTLSFDNAFDLVVDCTGVAEFVEQGLQLVKPDGCMVLIGLPHGDQNSTIKIHNMRQHFTGKKIIFSSGGSTVPNVDIPRYLELYKAGKLRLEKLITHRYSLGDINTALDTMRTGDCGRCIVEMP